MLPAFALNAKIAVVLIVFKNTYNLLVKSKFLIKNNSNIIQMRHFNYLKNLKMKDWLNLFKKKKFLLNRNSKIKNKIQSKILIIKNNLLCKIWISKKKLRFNKLMLNMKNWLMTKNKNSKISNHKPKTISFLKNKKLKIHWMPNSFHKLTERKKTFKVFWILKSKLTLKI